MVLVRSYGRGRRTRRARGALALDYAGEGCELRFVLNWITRDASRRAVSHVGSRGCERAGEQVGRPRPVERLRGRSLISPAIRARSSTVWMLRSVPFGKQ